MTTAKLSPVSAALMQMPVAMELSSAGKLKIFMYSQHGRQSPQKLNAAQIMELSEQDCDHHVRIQGLLVHQQHGSWVHGAHWRMQP